MAYNYEEKIVETIQYIVDHAVENAPYDKTIQAKIISCVDSTIGKYKVKYQDSTFYAYSTNIDVTYSKDADVYILVPGNNMSQEKTILGTTKKLGLDYVSTLEEKDYFDLIGTNCLQNNKSFELCSYKTEKREIYNYKSNINEIEVNIDNVNQYIKNSGAIVCEANFQTSLPKEQRFKGNYGIIYELAFFDDINNQETTQNYVLDINMMKGNPYLKTVPSLEYGIFNIDKDKFIRVNSVSLFVYDFPNQRDEEPSDIFISDLALYGSNYVDAEELNATRIVLQMLQGNYFNDKDDLKAEKEIEASIKIKGKIIDQNSQDIEYYWFIEDLEISSGGSKPGFNSFGGAGWRCLNEFTPINDSENLVEWNSAGRFFTVIKEENLAKENKYKCVAVYNETLLSKEFIIYNYSSQNDITIEIDSDSNVFHFDIGTPSITCLVNGNDYGQDNNYSFKWARVDNNGMYFALEDTIEDNNEYNDAFDKYNTLLKDIKNETALYKASESKLEEYLTIIKKYDKISRVERNKIFKIIIGKITDYNIYKCEVFYQGVKIGSSEIKIINSFDVLNDNYSLIIENGDQIYKYDESGISPTSSLSLVRQKIKPFGFILYDTDGAAIDKEAILKRGEVRWKVPIKDTLIQAPADYSPAIVEQTDDYIVYKNILDFDYTIASRYSFYKTNNDIELTVKYEGKQFITKTRLIFTKEGENGSNGTNYFINLVPNATRDNNNPPKYVIVKNGQLNFTPAKSNVWFKVQIWKNDEEIFNNSSTGQSTENKEVKVEWSVLRNKYNSTVSDNTSLIINKDSGAITYNGFSEDTPANLVKCSITYNGMKYYAVAPVITIQQSDNYDIEWLENSGFLQGLYTSDGLYPAYDNARPFEINVYQMINGYKENISNLESSSYKVDFDWNILGGIFIYKKDISISQEYNYYFVESNLLKIEDNSREELNKNQKKITLALEYDGACVTNAILVKIAQRDIEIGAIHLPIYLSLNRYGNSALNAWDGNSVTINENGGYILAPQMGAGEKDNNNNFTGIVMGKVQESNNPYSENGIFGYSAGIRSFYIDAKTGIAHFGVSGSGQIIIDPASGALLKSKDYEMGIGGMEIDLKDPHIYFGNGNFSVTKDGTLTTVQGKIAGFNFSPVKDRNGNIIGGYLDSNINSIYDYNFLDKTIVSLQLVGDLDSSIKRDLAYIYDYNDDNEIDVIDLALINRILNGTETNTRKVRGTFAINANDSKNCVVIKNAGGSNTVSLGIGGVEAVKVVSNLSVCTQKKEDYCNSIVQTPSNIYLYKEGSLKGLIGTNDKGLTINKEYWLDTVYPIGAIYISTVNTNPSNLFGGIWESIQDRFLLGAGSSYRAGSTGGSSTVTLTEDQIPSHWHWVPNYYSGGSSLPNLPAQGGSDLKGWSENIKTGNTGGGKSHNNMPPYLVVYMWKRTA